MNTRPRAIFADRVDAGRQLASQLSQYRDEPTIICAMPPGGVVVAAEIARALRAPISLVIPQLIGHPQAPLYPIGAVTETGIPAWDLNEWAATSANWRRSQILRARASARQIRRRYIGNQSQPTIRGCTAILVTDGVGLDLPVTAALRDLVSRHPRRIIIAMPVASQIFCETAASYADNVVSLYVTAGYLGAVGWYYQDFSNVTAEEIRGLLDSYRHIYEHPAENSLDLLALNSVLASLTNYPVTAGHISAQSRRLHAPQSVMSFFETLPFDTQFKSKADIIRHAEQAQTSDKDHSPSRSIALS